jgi:DNA-nicking Smr family endonuclease
MPKKKPSADQDRSLPLGHLARLLKEKKIALKKSEPPRPVTADGASELSPQQEAEMFKAAMADVTPLAWDCHWQWPKRRFAHASCQDDEERQTVESLSRLIEDGEGFTVADTGEYMEAAAPGVGSGITRSLHGGRYSIQDHVDLHGMTVGEAEEILHTFLKRAVSENKRAVLVVHGRGLRSPGPPVLKNHVFLWLTRGPLRKYVIALTSARSCDGGAGATYVLLRRRPAPGRSRKAAPRQMDDPGTSM